MSAFPALGEHVYDLAMYLGLLNASLYPKWPEIYATAEKVMQRLKVGDPDLHDHLQRVAQIEVNFNPKVSEQSCGVSCVRCVCFAFILFVLH